MSFESQPELQGECLRLRPLCRQDFANLYRVAADPLIWDQHPAFDRYQENVFRTLFEESLASGGALVAIDLATSEIIGSSRYHRYDEQASEVEIGWTFLARSHWGGRFNGEMKRLMLDHAFQFVHSVVFHVGPQNHRSQRAVEKIGGQRVGLGRDQTGQEYVLFRIRRPATST